MGDLDVARRVRRGAKRSTLLGLAALSTFAVLLRYPQNHEIGVDTYFIHGLALAITTTGSMSWLISPLSYAGLAPFSYPPAVPVTLAAFGQLSGVGLETAVFMYAAFLGAITPWTSFLLGKIACRKEGTALFVAFLVTSAQGMVGFTNWTVSARGTFYVFTPLVLALFLKATLPRGNAKAVWLAQILILASLALVHSLWLLLLPGLVACWLVYRLARAEHSLLSRRRGIRASSKVAIASMAAICAALVVFLEFGPSRVAVGSGLPRVIGNGVIAGLVVEIGLQYATVVGLGIALLPVGLFMVLRRAESHERYALLALSAIFLPISLDPVYGIALSIPVLLLVSGMSLEMSAKRRRPTRHRAPNLVIGVGAVVAVFVVAVPPLVTIPRTGALSCNQSSFLDDQTYNAGLYVKYLDRGNFTFAWDDGVEASRIEAISGIPGIEPLESLGTLEYPWLARKTPVNLAVTPDPLGSIVGTQQILSAREWLSEMGLQSSYYWGKHSFVLLHNPPGSPAAAQILAFYQTRYVIERCSSTDSPFFTSIQSTSYVVYADELQRTFRL